MTFFDPYLSISLCIKFSSLISDVTLEIKFFFFIFTTIIIIITTTTGQVEVRAGVTLVPHLLSMKQNSRMD